LGALYIRHGVSNSFIADFVELTSIEMSPYQPNEASEKKSANATPTTHFAMRFVLAILVA